MNVTDVRNKLNDIIQECADITVSFHADYIMTALEECNNPEEMCEILELRDTFYPLYDISTKLSNKQV